MSWTPDPVQPNKTTPVHVQVRLAIREAVRVGALTNGERLPSVRPLAESFGVNRLTVLKAVRALTRAGLLTTVKGKGIFVGPEAARCAAPEPTPGFDGPFFEGTAEGPHEIASVQAAIRNTVSDASREDLIMFSAGIPPREMLPTRAIRRKLATLLQEPDGPTHLGYAPTEGDAGLRDALLPMFAARGFVPSEEDSILITCGAQQGIVLCLDAVVRAGGAVALESPGYMGTIAACRLRGIPMVPVSLDAGGMSPAQLERALRQSEVRVLYTVPTYQNPTGITQSRRRRERLLSIAASRGVVVIEDDTYCDLRLGGRPIPPMKSLPGGENVVYVGSFSKSLAPGLRVGYVVASEPIASDLRYLKETIDISGGSLNQSVVAALLRDGQYAHHLARARRTYRARRDAMLAALEAHLPSWARFTRPKGGLHLWVIFDRPVDIDRLLARARTAGVTFTPGQLFYCDDRKASCLRLNFAAQSEERIEQGIERLARCIRLEAKP